MENKRNRTAVTVARLIYLIISILSGGISVYLLTQGDLGYIWVGIAIGLVIGLFFIYIESLSKTFSIRGFSTATVGLAIGFFCAWVLQAANFPSIFIEFFVLNDLSFENVKLDPDVIRMVFNFILFSSLGFIGAVLALRTNQDDFSMIIPFIRFRQENQKFRPIVCGLDAFLDGRLIKFIDSGFVSNNVIIPPYTIDQLRKISESSIELERQRGRRGIETIEKLTEMESVNVALHTFDTDKKSGDIIEDIILTCKQLNARLFTCDSKLAQVAAIRDISVLNLSNLEEAAYPIILIGEVVKVALVKEGKEEHQAIGFLHDGTMIVVNDAKDLIGQSKSVKTISSIDTISGKMFFAELEETMH